MLQKAGFNDKNLAAPIFKDVWFFIKFYFLDLFEQRKTITVFNKISHVEIKYLKMEHFFYSV